MKKPAVCGLFHGWDEARINRSGGGPIGHAGMANVAGP